MHSAYKSFSESYIAVRCILAANQQHNFYCWWLNDCQTIICRCLCQTDLTEVLCKSVLTAGSVSSDDNIRSILHTLTVLRFWHHMTSRNECLWFLHYKLFFLPGQAFLWECAFFSLPSWNWSCCKRQFSMSCSLANPAGTGNGGTHFSVHKKKFFSLLDRNRFRQDIKGASRTNFLFTRNSSSVHPLETGTGQTSIVSSRNGYWVYPFETGTGRQVFSSQLGMSLVSLLEVGQMFLPTATANQTPSSTSHKGVIEFFCLEKLFMPCNSVAVGIWC